MIADVAQLLETIEDDEKLIAYLKKMYKEKTGEDIIIPDFKNINAKNIKKEEEAEVNPNLKFHTFKDKVTALKLPDKGDREARMRLDKLRRAKDTKVLFKKLDISYFSGKGITSELLYKVLEGLNVLRSVEEIDLSHNGLGDNFIDVISDYLMMKGLLRINLSYNNLTKASVKKLVATLKGCRRLESIDVSYNPFNLDEYACMQICSALKDCDKIIHFGICDSSRESSLRFISHHPTLRSVNLEDCRYKKRAWESLSRIILNNKKYDINRLSLKFCKIDFIYATPCLVKALKKNNKLMYLNLYNTGLDDFSGALIITALINHKLLEELDLGFNFLGGHFCKAFGKVLKNNNILRKVSLTKNYSISKDDYYYIIEGLTNNQSIVSLGDLTYMKIGVKYRESTEKLLLLNQVLDWRNVNNIKNQKASLYMSNVGLEHLQKTKMNEKIKDIGDKGVNDKNENQKINTNRSIKIEIKVKEKDKNNIEKGKKPAPKYIELPIENSNHIDKLTEKLPEGTLNQFYKDSLNNQSYYSNDVNDMIESMDLLKKTQTSFIKERNNNSQDKSFNQSNFNKQGKFIVPLSIPGSHVLKDLEEYEEEESGGGKKKKKKITSKSVSKFSKKRKNKSKPPTIVNTIASIAQEIIDKDQELQNSLRNSNQLLNNGSNGFISSNRYPQVDIGKDENMSYGRIGFNTFELNQENKDNIVSKYNLFENNFGTDFQEQEPFFI